MLQAQRSTLCTVRFYSLGAQSGMLPVVVSAARSANISIGVRRMLGSSVSQVPLQLVEQARLSSRS